MDEIKIKQEIKEEIQEDFYHTSNYEGNESMLLNVVKDEEDFDEYEDNQPNYQDEDASSCSENTEKVFINGEPEIYIPINVQQINFKEENSDPLDITPEQPTSTSMQPIIRDIQMTSEKRDNFKRIRVIRLMKEPPPVKDLVQKTYSKKHKEAPHSCTVCKKIFCSVHLLREHERSCFKCKQCNLIVSTMSHLVNHIKKCRRKEQNEPANSPKQIRHAGYVGSKSSCNICSFTFLSNKELVEHQRQNHATPNAYACHICDRKFDSETEALCHISTCH